jgi:hypothetical protein
MLYPQPEIKSAFSDFNKAISILYEVFSENYPLKPNFIDRCCPCCAPSSKERINLLKPLKTISIDDFGRYPGKAIYTWGNEQDFKYFLPRMLELNIYINEYDSCWLLGKLEYIDWLSWPDIEKNVFLDFCINYFYNFLETFQFYEADQWSDLLLELAQKFKINFCFNATFLKIILKKFLETVLPNKHTGSSIDDFFYTVTKLFNMDDVATILTTFERKDLLHFAFFMRAFSFNKCIISKHCLSWAVNYRKILEEAFFDKDKPNKEYGDLISTAEEVLFMLIKQSE